MRIDQELSALRSSPQPMRAAQAVLEQARDEWIAQVAEGRLVPELALYASGEALASLPALSHLMTNLAAAQSLADSLTAAMIPAMRSKPFALVPFRHQSTRYHCIVELARSGTAALSLMVYWRRGAGRSETVCFTSGERREICLRGKAEARELGLVASDSAVATLTDQAFTINSGWAAGYDNAHATKLVEQVASPMVILRLARDALCPMPAREYRIEDGALVHQSAADRIDSRREMALAVLGSMGRRDALPAMLAASSSGPPHVRWEAVRQMLALDTATGFRALSTMADDPADELSAPAQQLRSALMRSHPALASLREAVPCPG